MERCVVPVKEAQSTEPGVDPVVVDGSDVLIQTLVRRRLSQVDQDPSSRECCCPVPGMLGLKLPLPSRVRPLNSTLKSVPPLPMTKPLWPAGFFNRDRGVRNPALHF